MKLIILTILTFLSINSYSRVYHISIVNDSFRFNKPLPSTKSSEELNSALEDKIEDLQYFPMENMTYDSLLKQISILTMDLKEIDTLILSIFTHGEIDSIIDKNDRNFAYSAIYDVIKIPKNFVIINDACYGVSCFKAFKSGIIFANKTKGYTSLDLGFFIVMNNYKSLKLYFIF